MNQSELAQYEGFRLDVSRIIEEADATGKDPAARLDGVLQAASRTTVYHMVRVLVGGQLSAFRVRQQKKAK